MLTSLLEEKPHYNSYVEARGQCNPLWRFVIFETVAPIDLELSTWLGWWPVSPRGLHVSISPVLGFKHQTPSF